MSEKENIVKQTAKELGMTYEELGEAIGYSKDAIAKASTKQGTVSKPLMKAISLLLEKRELENKMSEFTQLREILRNIIK